MKRESKVKIVITKEYIRKIKQNATDDYNRNILKFGGEDGSIAFVYICAVLNSLNIPYEVDENK